MTNGERRISACATWSFAASYLALQHWLAPGREWQFVAVAAGVACLHFAAAIFAKD